MIIGKLAILAVVVFILYRVYRSMEKSIKKDSIVEPIKEQQEEMEMTVEAAEKELEVARLAALQAKEEADARLTRERAEADANKLKVQAGLTPQQRLEGQISIADKVSKNIAEGIARADFPDVVVTGSNANGSAGIDLVSMMGINQAMELVEKMSNSSAVR